MKVMLIRPDYSEEAMSNRRLGTIHQPIGLLYLAAGLEQNGHEVIICDEMVADDLSQMIRDHKPDLIGITVTSLLFQRVCSIIKEIRSVDPNTKIILGGPHISAVPRLSLEMSGADGAVVGEGEETIIELAGGRSWSSIRGLNYFENGEWRSNERRLAPDINALPMPARHLLERSKYLGEHEVGFRVGQKNTLLRLFTSRGCPFQCTFCCSHNIFGRKARFRSAESVLAEIEQGIKDWKTTNVMFMDDTFTLNKDHVQEICDAIIKSGHTIRWGCFARATLSEEMIIMMKRAGCHMMGFGVESGSQRILDMMKKRTKIPEIKQTLALCRKHGIRTKAFIMVGLPHETTEDYNQTVALVLGSKLDYLLVSVFVPLPGSEILSECPDFDPSMQTRGNFYYSGDPIWKERQVELLRKFHFRLSYALNSLRKFSLVEIPDYWYMLRAFLTVRREMAARIEQS
ncbi:radical SAM protein [bacterium]|nr:radical SAM protein [bacterium]